jgi:hypothetical protein
VLVEEFSPLTVILIVSSGRSEERKKGFRRKTLNLTLIVEEVSFRSICEDCVCSDFLIELLPE